MKRKMSGLAPTTVTRRIVAACVLLLLGLASFLVACAGPASTSTPAQTAPSDSAAFQTVRLTIIPAEVEPGEKVVVTAMVTNTGDTQDSYAAQLRINNIAEAVKKLTMPAGGTQTLTFLVSTGMQGPYRVTFGELSGQFVVGKPAEQLRPGNPEFSVSEASGSSCCRSTAQSCCTRRSTVPSCCR